MILDEARLLPQGRSFAELRDHRKQSLADGEYPIAGPGLVYMISDFNYIYNPARDAFIDAAPHVMYHAPGLSHADIGSDRAVAMANRGLPFINAEGPHGFMIGFTELGSDPAPVLAACRGQLPDAAKFRPFPPPR